MGGILPTSAGLSTPLALWPNEMITLDALRVLKAAGRV